MCLGRLALAQTLNPHILSVDGCATARQQPCGCNKHLFALVNLKHRVMMVGSLQLSAADCEAHLVKVMLLVAAARHLACNEEGPPVGPPHRLLCAEKDLRAGPFTDRLCGALSEEAMSVRPRRQ